MTPQAPEPVRDLAAVTPPKGPEAFRTISEASSELGVPSHVLRFWETKFSFIRPMKRAGGRRFYRPRDLEVLKGVRALLHEEGYTIKGVQRLHKEQGVRRLVAAGGADAGLVEEEEMVEEVVKAPAATLAMSTPPTRRLRLSAASDAPIERPAPGAPVTPAPVAPAPVPPLLSPQARRRLEDALGDLETTKAAIDALLAAPAARRKAD